MAWDQDFCFRWDDHQTTLVYMINQFLSNERLADCTLAAEGQYMKVHKVILSAYSQYFELLLSETNDKHPIIILQDVTFRQLEALVEYMYQGELNVPRAQYSAFIIVAVNLQMKGISHYGWPGIEPARKPPEKRKLSLPPPPPKPQPSTIISCPGIEPGAPSSSIELQRSNEPDISYTINSRPGLTIVPANIASTLVSTPVDVFPDLPPVLDRTNHHILSELDHPTHEDISNTELNREMILEQIHEYPNDEINEDSPEDLITKDDMNDLDQPQAGPSDDGFSNEVVIPLHMTSDRFTDVVFMQTQEADGAQRDSQEIPDPDEQMISDSVNAASISSQDTVINHAHDPNDTSIVITNPEETNSDSRASLGIRSQKMLILKHRIQEPSGPLLKECSILLQRCDDGIGAGSTSVEEQIMEYPNDNVNEDSVKGLSLEDYMNDLVQAKTRPPGKGSSSQGSTSVQMISDGPTNEVCMQVQEAVSAQRVSQEIPDPEEKMNSNCEVAASHTSQCSQETVINHAHDPNNTSIVIPNTEVTNSESYDAIGISSQQMLMQGIQETCTPLFSESHVLMKRCDNVVDAGSTSANGQIMISEPSSHLNTTHVDEKTETIFQCAHCPKSFQRKNHLCRHLKYGNCKTELVECGQCSQQFTNKCSLIDHLRNMCSKQKQHMCGYCKRHFKVKKNLLYHLNRECGKINAYQCPKCQKQYLFRKNLNFHLKNECATRKELKCPKCNKQFVSRATLDQHVRNHCGRMEQFSCPSCSKKYMCKSTLNSHMKHDCGRTEPHKCSQCQKLIPTKKSMNAHLKNRCGKNEQFSCPSCSKMFQWKSTLTSHMKHDCGRTEPLKCPQCQRLFFNKLSMDVHLKNRCGKNEQFSCPSCSKMFRWKATLSAHMKHDCGRTEPHKCSQCPRLFSNKFSLEAHLKNRCGKTKQFSCPSCSKSFSWKFSLSAHMKHDCGRTAPHKCSQCPRLFSNKFSLDAHLKNRCGNKN